MIQSSRTAPYNISDVSTLEERLASMGGMVCVAGPGNLFTAQSTSATMVTSHTKHIAVHGAHNVRLVYANHYGTAEVLNDANLAVKASVELAWAGGTRYPVYFRGARSATVEPGGLLISDPLGIDIAPGTAFGVYTGVTPAGGGNYLRGRSTRSADGEGVYTAGDRVDSTAVSASNTTCYSPVAILGVPTNVGPSIAIFGDSIIAGSGDTTVTDRGWARIAIGSTYPHLTLCKSSEKFENFMGASRQRRGVIASGCTHAVCHYGANDLSTALATLKTNALDVWKSLADRGIKVFQATLIPNTTSTDTWQTVANQTVTANEANRLAINAWFRDASASGAIAQSGGDLSGIIEVANTVEVNASNVLTQNGGFWIVDGSANYPTTDGVHPSTAAHTLMAAALDTSIFSV